MSGARLAAGVDVALERKGIDLVALDERRAVVASCGRLAVADVARCMAELRPAVVCIDSPPAWAPTGRNRIAERALWAAGIGIFGTPAPTSDRIGSTTGCGSACSTGRGSPSHCCPTSTASTPPSPRSRAKSH